MALFGQGKKQQGRDASGQYQTIAKSPTQSVDTSKFVTPQPMRKSAPTKAKGVRGCTNYQTLDTAWNIILVRIRAGAFTR